jgi:hypothetical protein
MRRLGLNGAKRRVKRVLAVMGLGLGLTVATLPAQAFAHGTPKGNAYGQTGGNGNGHKVG